MSLADTEFAVGDYAYCITWVDEDNADHVLAREQDSDQWCSVAQAHPNDGICVADEGLPWAVVRELLARQLRRGGFTGIVRLPNGREEEL